MKGFLDEFNLLVSECIRKKSSVPCDKLFTRNGTPNEIAGLMFLDSKSGDEWQLMCGNSLVLSGSGMLTCGIELFQEAQYLNSL